MSRKRSRRAYLRSAAGIGITGLSTLASQSEPATTRDVTAAALLVPETSVPTGFSPYQPDSNTSFVDALRSTDANLTGMDVSVSGYWRGGSRDDPHEVIGSQALVTTEPISEDALITASEQSYDSFVEWYDNETGPWIEFEQTRTVGEHVADWQVDIYRNGPLTDGRERIYTDIMCQQHFDNVVLGTTVFGPTDASPSIPTRADRYTTEQRARYRAPTEVLND